MSIDVSSLPAFNAMMNSCAFICLVASLTAIKKRKEVLHRNLIFVALGFSALFLTSYLYYHYHHGHTVFAHQGLVKFIYYVILIPHVLLAAAMVPLIFLTVYLGLTEKREKHKKWARITMPIWLYVSITGVLIYLMLYVWFA